MRRFGKSGAQHVGVAMTEDAKGSDRTLHRLVADDLASRKEWARKDDVILRRRLGDRPKQKTKPYPGAPNFVETLIDDVVRERTDQECSMFFNSPRLCHVAAIDPMTPEERSAIESGFDDFLRYIVPQSHAKLEECFDTKNARGFAVAKQTRGVSMVTGKAIPDFEVCDNLDVIVPADTKHTQQAERICHVLRYTERELLQKIESKGWDRAAVMEAINTAKTDDRGNKSDATDDGDTYEKVKNLVGLAKSTSEYVVVWEIYHYAGKDDAAANPSDIIEGRRMVTIMCPDLPDKPFAKYGWLEMDTIDPVTGAVMIGPDRKWPFVQFRFENRSRYWYDSRGAGHLIMDEQIAATAMRNAQAVMAEFYMNPMFRGLPSNSGNFTFAPGSTLPEGAELVQPPTVPMQFNFDRNDFRATAGRRVGAGSTYNYSLDMGSRKVQKTAEEVSTETMRTTMVSSASVDRFNDPMAELCQMLWEDLARMGETFPLVSTGQGPFNVEMYRWKLMLIPASSAKTLNPDAVLSRIMNMYQFNAAHAQATGFNHLEAMRAVNASWDSRMTKGWLPDGQAESSMLQALAQMQQDVVQLAQGGKQLSERLASVEKLATGVYDKVAKTGGPVVRPPTLPGG